MSNSEYATLEEAFGVTSFNSSPEPLVLRGNVGSINDARQQTMQKDIVAMGHAAAPPTTSATRMPVECQRCDSGTGCFDISQMLSKTYAEGGARAVWDLLPRAHHDDIAWYGIAKNVRPSSDHVLMLAAALAIYVLLVRSSRRQ